MFNLQLVVEDIIALDTLILCLKLAHVCLTKHIHVYIQSQNNYSGIADQNIIVCLSEKYQCTYGAFAFQLGIGEYMGETDNHLLKNSLIAI